MKDTYQNVYLLFYLQSPLVQPIVTPRFAPTCPEDQLASLGQLAAKYGCHIQSHLCETQPECNWVKELFPWAKSYTDVYDSMRLLSEKVGDIFSVCIGLDTFILFFVISKCSFISMIKLLLLMK